MTDNKITDFTSFENENAVRLFKEALEKMGSLSEVEKLYLNECKKTDATLEDVEEGLLGGIIGGVAGLAFGPKVGDAVCKALGITKGTLYDLLHSRVFTAAVCTYLGIKA